MITLKNNAPVKFLEEGDTPFDELSSDCNCIGQDFCQIVHSGDNTPFQLGLSEATGTDLVANGTFAVDASWTKGSGWTIGLNRASHSGGGGGELSQTISSLRASTYYKLVFSVSSYSNSQTMLVSLTGDVIKTLNANGTYTVYWFTDSTLTNQILKFTPHTSTTLNIDDVQLYEMSTVVYGIKDMDNQVVKTVSNGTGVTYYQDSASVEVDWSDVNEGCYRLFLIDNSNNLFTDCGSGTFETTDASWAINVANIGVSRSSTAAREGTYSALCEHPGGGADLDFPIVFSGITNITVEPNKDYIISGWVKFPSSISATSSTQEGVYLKPSTYSLSQCDLVRMAFAASGMSGGFFGNHIFEDGNYITSTFGSVNDWHYISTFFNSGVNTSITIGVYLNGQLSNYNTSGIGFSFYIDSLEMRGPSEIQSECFTLGEFSCTKLLSWSSNENSYGHIFEGTTFQHELRVNSKLWKPKYPKDRKEVFVDSVGHRTILTSRTKKEELLTIQHLPEYLHDALSVGVEHDNFYIDGEKYINEENDYSPRWRDSSITAPVEITVVKDNQDLSNTYC